MRRKDGSWAWVLSRGEVVARDGEGRPLRKVGTHKDITARRDAAASLAASDAVARRQLAELEAVYGSAPVGLAFVGADLRYVRVNDRLATLNGVPPAAHVGRTPAEITPALAPFLEPLLRGVLATGAPVRGQQFRTEAPGEPGAVRDWLLDYQPAVDASGAIVGVTCSVAEVTALKRAEAARDRLLAREEAAHAAADAARARAEEAARTKSAFLATMSHELRTPLNAIAGHVQLLEMGIHGPVTAAQTDALKRVDLAQRHLLRLVNDVLALARLEAHGVSYKVQDVSLADVVAELDPLVGPLACAKGVTLSMDVDLACAVRGDRDKLVQVLVNLVSNAIKFTDAGGAVTVECATRAAGDDDAGVVHLRVRDTGIGIPADRLEYIFDPYAQMDTTTAGQAAGTGLGLAISRNLARGMGGDIRARSTPGAGSAFTVTLPRAGA
jgi:signal transduction histidine kinase